MIQCTGWWWLVLPKKEKGLWGLKADEFNEFGLYSDKSKKPNETSPVITNLPLKIKKENQVISENTSKNYAILFGKTNI